MAISKVKQLHGEVTVPGDKSISHRDVMFGAISNGITELTVILSGGDCISTINCFRKMGIDIEQNGDHVIVHGKGLHGCEISRDIIPTLIDEIPVIAVMAACAAGTTTISDAAELKVKESNRIDTVVENLSSMGANITPTDDGMIIEGGQALSGAHIKTYLDHRIAMSFAIAGLVANGETTFDDESCCCISYPEFFET